MNSLTTHYRRSQLIALPVPVLQIRARRSRISSNPDSLSC